MKKSLFKLFITGALLTFIAIGLHAQPPCTGQGPGQGRGFRNNTEKPFLNLSDDQKEAMKTLRIDHQKKLVPLRNQMAELKAHQRTLMSEESVDMKQVDKNIDEQTALMNKIQKLQAEHRVAVKGILTDEQELMLAGKPGRGNRNGFGGPCGNCPRQFNN